MCDDVIEYNPICLLPSWESQVLLDVAASLQHLALHPFIWGGGGDGYGRKNREGKSNVSSSPNPFLSQLLIDNGQALWKESQYYRV